MSEIPTMRVTNDEGVEMVINVEDFDAAVHVACDGEAAPEGDAYAGVAVTGDAAPVAKAKRASKPRKRKQ